MTETKHVDPTKSESKSPATNSDATQLHASSSAPHEKIMQLQRSVGNSVVGQAFSPALSPENPDAGSPVQMKRNGAIPEELQAKMESSLGQDFSNVAIQKNSQKASNLNALAFTQGDNIHFAPGQFNPHSAGGKNLIGHEFTHVAQQRSGVVKPTSVMGKGLSVNEDISLENEADDLGKRAVQGETISKYQSATMGIRSSLRSVQAKSSIVQLAKHPSHFGDWYDDKFTISTATGQHSVEMDLKFDPNSQVNAELIGITQTVRSIKNKKPYYINNDKKIKSRSIQSGGAITIDSATKETDEGTHIDQAKHNRNPLYAVEGAPKSDKNLYDTLPVKGDVTKRNTWGRHGFRYMKGKVLKKQEALLHDKTGLNVAGKDSGQIFETTALAIKGSQKDTYYGSVQWGWRTDSAGSHTKIPFKVVSEGVPSSTFMKSSEMWNASKSSTGANTVNLPLVDVKITKVPITGQYPANFIGPPLQIPVDTRVQIIRNAVAPSTNGEIKVVDGIFVDNILEVTPSDMATLGDERP